MLTKFFTYYKVLLNYIGILISYHKRSRGDINYKKKVVLNFRKIDRERNYAQLVFFFSECEYKVILIHRPLFLGNMITYGKYIVNLANVTLKLATPSNRDNTIYFYDTKSDKKNCYRKQIYINDDVFLSSKKLSELELVPFPMIPRLYYQGHYKLVNSLRNTVKKFRIYFSGNQNKSDYDSPFFKTYFNKLNRIEVIENLKEKLKPDDLIISNNVAETLDRSEEYQNKFICHQWTRVSIKNNKIRGRTSNDKWLPMLAKADFFLACPGFIQPMCHNQIEAMSLGVVLILEHPEFFDPPLQHMKNCVVFRGRDDLIEKVEWVLSIDTQTIVRMREETLEYYHNHLSPESFCRKIESKMAGNHTLHVVTSNSACRELAKINQ